MVQILLQQKAAETLRPISYQLAPRVLGRVMRGRSTTPAVRRAYSERARERQEMRDGRVAQKMTAIQLFIRYRIQAWPRARQCVPSRPRFLRARREPFP